MKLNFDEIFCRYANLNMALHVAKFRISFMLRSIFLNFSLIKNKKIEIN